MKVALPTPEQANKWTTETAERIAALSSEGQITALIKEPAFFAWLAAVRSVYPRLAEEIDDYLEGQRAHVSRTSTADIDQGLDGVRPLSG